MSGPLEGLRVIDCASIAAGARATGFLADYGADVVWIEPPGGASLRTDATVAASVYGRSKRSVELDLEDSADRDRLRGLLAAADVFVHTWAPGVPESLGLGCDELHELNPGLVQCALTAFGQDGPHAQVPAEESIVHAIVGTTADQAGHREGPIYQGLPFATIGAAYLALIGILGALLRREEDGHGRAVDTSLLDGALAYHSMLWGESDATAGLPAPTLKPGMYIPIRLITRSFQCADGEIIGIHTGAKGAFGRLMEVVGLAERIPPSEDGMDIGMPVTPEQGEILQHELPAIFLTRSRDEWIKLLLEADVCAVEHQRPTEVFDAPQARHNGMVISVDDPELGLIDQVAPPLRMSDHMTLSDPRPTPLVGVDTDSVLSDPSWAAAAAHSSGAPDTRPLFDGLKVLDLGAFFAGPFSSRLLADHGADVIKFEPTAGDMLRALDNPFFACQAGKRCIAADAKDPELRPAVEALLRWADVVHHNLRPGAAERLGLDYDTVSKINPEIIYLYAPGWGSEGPHRLRQSFAPMLSGYVGVTYEVAGQYNEPMPPVGNEDPGNGLLGAVGVLLALWDRRKTGTGQYLENPQLNATMSHLAHIVRNADGEALGAGTLDVMQYGVGPFDRLYRTEDGWLNVVARGDGQVAALGKVLGVDTAGGGDDLSVALETAFAKRPTTELKDELVAAGVGVAEPVPERNNHAFMNDPENRRTGRVAEVDHPAKGKVRELAVLVRVSDAVAPAHRPAPELGQHTDEVLMELGYEAEQLTALRERGAIR